MNGIYLGSSVPDIQNSRRHFVEFKGQSYSFLDKEIFNIPISLATSHKIVEVASILGACMYDGLTKSCLYCDLKDGKNCKYKRRVNLKWTAEKDNLPVEIQECGADDAKILVLIEHNLLEHYKLEEKVASPSI